MLDHLFAYPPRFAYPERIPEVALSVPVDLSQLEILAPEQIQARIYRIENQVAALDAAIDDIMTFLGRQSHDG